MGVRSSDLIGSGALGASSAAEALEEGKKMLFEPVDRKMEVPEENALTTDMLPKEADVTVASSSIHIISRAEPSPRLEGLKAAEGPLLEDGMRVLTLLVLLRLQLSFRCRPPSGPP